MDTTRCCRESAGKAVSGSLLLAFDVAERRALAATTLAPLVRSLRWEVEPMFNGPLPIPERKARLTRVGGRCSFDGTLLDFDPWSPVEHRCPQCRRVFIGVEHQDWWAMGAQLWTAERAAQSAALHLLADDRECAALSLRILTELADRYSSWPNRDNALGPTRPFFSTYLESIWLLNICHAIALLEAGTVQCSTQLEYIRTVLVQPSRDLIAGYHEGRSNRQVWNEVAILSASCVLGDTATISRRLASADGLRDHFANGLLDDGTWYEGENYHLFAHRGLWYGVELMRALQQPLDGSHEARFRAGFVAPFLGILPDLTLPSRRDSQYKVSIRQWRFAEWCELGIAHATRQCLANGAVPDLRLDAILHRLYDSDLAHDQHRHRVSTADSERNEPPGKLSRSSLSWRSLVMANAELPRPAAWKPASVCLPQQGLAVVRREQGRMYIALEGGHTGGGHGHPDRLALTLQYDDKRWLEDSGTGSYVEQKLHWYRSTLAHFAPLVNGASQDSVPAQLVAYEDRGGAGWICKRVDSLSRGVNMQRTIVVADGYLVDFLEWKADRGCQVDLPVARRATVNANQWATAAATGAGGLEDGFDFLTDVAVTPLEARQVTLRPEPTQPEISANYFSSVPISLWRATAPLPPGEGVGPLHWLRMNASQGTLVGVWGWKDFSCDWTTSADGIVAVTTGEGTTAHHKRTEHGWHIALTAGNATSSIELGGLQITELQLPVPTANTDTPTSGYSMHLAKDIITLVRPGKSGSISDSALLASVGQPIAGATRFELGQSHYVQTEQSWREAGKPTATVQLGVTAHSIVIDIVAVTGPLAVPDVHEENLLDNERRDVNSDGVQIHFAPTAGSAWTAAWIAVPAQDCYPEARITPTTLNAPVLKTGWMLLKNGWAMRCLISLHDIPFSNDETFALEIIVNERSSDRQRRRGQLALSGGGGFGYLRGDRTDSVHALTFKLAPVAATTA